jgi:hypothetical protein
MVNKMEIFRVIVLVKQWVFTISRTISVHSLLFVSFFVHIDNIPYHGVNCNSNVEKKVILLVEGCLKKIQIQEAIMAEKLKAINLLRPKLKLGRMFSMDQVAPYVADRTGLNRGVILNVLNEFCDTLIFFALDGRTVKLDGLGRFSPKIGLDGTISISARLDNRMQKRLNDEGLFKGEIQNRDNIGKTPDELVALWNEIHPEDPVV